MATIIITFTYETIYEILLKELHTYFRSFGKIHFNISLPYMTDKQWEGYVMLNWILGNSNAYENTYGDTMIRFHIDSSLWENSQLHFTHWLSPFGVNTSLI